MKTRSRLLRSEVWAQAVCAAGNARVMARCEEVGCYGRLESFWRVEVVRLLLRSFSGDIGLA